MTLRETIYQVFPKEGAPNYKLSDAIIADDYGDSSCAFEEKWVSWDEIENWQIANTNGVFFSFAPRDVCAYLIPRFMIFTIDEHEGKLGEFARLAASDCAGDYVALLEKKHFDYAGTNFTTSQIQVLKNFLDYVREIEDGRQQQ